MKDNQLIKLLHDASVNFLQNVSISCGLAGNRLYPSTVHGICSLFCSMLNSGNQEWCNLTLVRGVVQSPRMCKSVSTKPWIDMLLGFISVSNSAGGNVVNLPKQVSTSLFLSNNFKVLQLTFYNVETEGTVL